MLPIDSKIEERWNIKAFVASWASPAADFDRTNSQSLFISVATNDYVVNVIISEKIGITTKHSLIKVN